MYPHDEEYCTPMLKASQGNYKFCVESLLGHGADANDEDRYGYTALHYSVLYEDVQLAHLLLAHGANINAQTKEGFTPYLFAVQVNNRLLVELLEDWGADTHAEELLDRKHRKIHQKRVRKHAPPRCPESAYNTSTSVFGRASNSHGHDNPEPTRKSDSNFNAKVERPSNENTQKALNGSATAASGSRTAAPPSPDWSLSSLSFPPSPSLDFALACLSPLPPSPSPPPPSDFPLASLSPSPPPAPRNSPHSSHSPTNLSAATAPDFPCAADPTRTVSPNTLATPAITDLPAPPACLVPTSPIILHVPVGHGYLPLLTRRLSTSPALPPADNDHQAVQAHKEENKDRNERTFPLERRNQNKLKKCSRRELEIRQTLESCTTKMDTTLHVRSCPRSVRTVRFEDHPEAVPSKRPTQRKNVTDVPATGNENMKRTEQILLKLHPTLFPPFMSYILRPTKKTSNERYKDGDKKIPCQDKTTAISQRRKLQMPLLMTVLVWTMKTITWCKYKT